MLLIFNRVLARQSECAVLITFSKAGGIEPFQFANFYVRVGNHVVEIKWINKLKVKRTVRVPVELINQKKLIKIHITVATIVHPNKKIQPRCSLAVPRSHVTAAYFISGPLASWAKGERGGRRYRSSVGNMEGEFSAVQATCHSTHIAVGAAKNEREKKKNSLRLTRLLYLPNYTISSTDGWTKSIVKPEAKYCYLRFPKIIPRSILIKMIKHEPESAVSTPWPSINRVFIFTSSLTVKFTVW